MCSYRRLVEIAIYRHEKCFVKFLGIHCPNTICNNGGYLDQNCECICPDGSSDCQQGKTRQNPGKKITKYLFKNKTFYLNLLK